MFCIIYLKQQIQDNSSKEELWTFLTAKLKEKVQQLKQCVIPSSSLASLPQGGNVSLLREYVQQQKHTLFNMQQQIRTITEEVRHIRQHYHQALHKCFSVLAQLLEKYKLTTQQRCDHILIKLLHARAQLMFKQLAYIELVFFSDSSLDLKCSFSFSFANTIINFSGDLQGSGSADCECSVHTRERVCSSTNSSAS